MKCVRIYIYACTTFGLFVFSPRDIPPLQRGTSACLVTTDLILRVNVRTRTSLLHQVVVVVYELHPGGVASRNGAGIENQREEKWPPGNYPVK